MLGIVVDLIVLPCRLVVVYVVGEHAADACIDVGILVPLRALTIFEDEILVAVIIIIYNVCHRLVGNARHVGDSAWRGEFGVCEPPCKVALVGCESCWHLALSCWSIVRTCIEKIPVSHAVAAAVTGVVGVRES